jgi:TonB family protein
MKILVAVGVVAVAATSSQALAGPVVSPFSGSAAVAKSSEAEPAPVLGVLGFPARLGGSDLGRAHIIANELPLRPGTTLTSKVLVCIVPSGTVAAARLLKSSGAPSFDKAVVASAHRWVYQKYAAPEGTRICAAVSIVYRPPARAARRAPARSPSVTGSNADLLPVLERMADR